MGGSTSKIQDVMKVMVFKGDLDDAQIDTIWEKYDTDASGELNTAEFDLFFKDFTIYCVDNAKQTTHTRDELLEIVNREDFNATVNAQFAEWDLNKDGNISKAEFKQTLKSMLEEVRFLIA